MSNRYILFICKENDLHCSLAQAFYNKHAKKTKAIAVAKKTDKQHPKTSEILAEQQLTYHKPDIYTFDLLQNAAKVITFGCEGGVCLPFPSEEWHIDNPDIKKMSDSIKKEVKKLVKVIDNDSNKTI